MGWQRAALNLRLALRKLAGEGVQGHTYQKRTNFLLSPYELTIDEARRKLNHIKPRKGKNIYQLGEHLWRTVALAQIIDHCWLWINYVWFQINLVVILVAQCYIFKFLVRIFIMPNMLILGILYRQWRRNLCHLGQIFSASSPKVLVISRGSQMNMADMRNHDRLTSVKNALLEAKRKEVEI